MVVGRPLRNDFPERTFTTANEIYVPVGVPVTVKLAANDVIHSFWVPSLMGKLDLIPGQDNETQFVASRPGVYRGQCAEFCGWQHAHMGLLVIACQGPNSMHGARLSALPPRPPRIGSARKEPSFLPARRVSCATPSGARPPVARRS